MKRLLLICIAAFAAAVAVAQNVSPTVNWPYMYPDFLEGEIEKIGGLVEKGRYNIHLNIGTLHYLKDGTIEEHPENWEEHTVINLVERLEPGKLSLIIDCGYDDFFFEVNCNLHDKLLKAGIKHDFYVREGVHNWDYWRNSIQYQLLYFSNYFKTHPNK